MTPRILSAGSLRDRFARLASALRNTDSAESRASASSLGLFRLELRAHRTAQVKDAARAMKRAHTFVRERNALARTQRWAVLSGALASLCIFLGAPSAQAASCPNEELRQGPAASLPDCRAYEMVSPVDKNTHSVQGATTYSDIGQAAAAGGSVSYGASGAFPGSATAAIPSEYISTRGEGGWTTRPVFPPQAYSYSAALVEVNMLSYSPDLSRSVLYDGTDSPPLVAGEQEPGGATRTSNLFLRDNATGAYSLINFPAPGLTPPAYQPTFDGASADFSSVIFNAPVALTPEAPLGGAEDLYLWQQSGHGACHEASGCIGLISQIPPAGQPSCGAAGPACLPAPHGGRFAGENAINVTELNPQAPDQSPIGAISADGSRAFFTAEGNLYLRQNGETTVQVDAPQGGSGPGGGGQWASAAADGSRVFFYDNASAGLTADTVPASGKNLYSYDTATGALADLTPGPQPGILGIANTASGDGAYLYFLANGVLTTEPNSLGQTASPGDCPQDAGSCNLYLSHDGAISFIHAVSSNAALYDYTGFQPRLLQYHSASSIAPDGRHFAFFAEGGFASTGSEMSFGELFEYSAESGQTTHLCACAASEFRQFSTNLLSAPQATHVFQYARTISADGSRLFLESYRALVPHDTNGQSDVYQWEAQGQGTCDQAAGCLSLISSGTSAQGSWFLDASASGQDVFFTTQQQLAPADADGAFDLYDARENGGFPQPTPTAPCLGDACAPPPTVLNDPTPASSTYHGPGNLHEEAAKPKKHKKSHKRHHTRHANTNRRAGK